MPMLSMKTKNPMKPMFEILAITDDAGLSSPATVLQVVWRSIWQFLDAILLGPGGSESGGSSAKIISAYPAYR